MMFICIIIRYLIHLTLSLKLKGDSSFSNLQTIAIWYSFLSWEYMCSEHMYALTMNYCIGSNTESLSLPIDVFMLLKVKRFTDTWDLCNYCFIVRAYTWSEHMNVQIFGVAKGLVILGPKGPGSGNIGPSGPIYGILLCVGRQPRAPEKNF